MKLTQKQIDFISKLPIWKRALIDKGLTRGKVRCPRCSEKTCVLDIEGRKHHVHAFCTNEGCDFKLQE